MRSALRLERVSHDTDTTILTAGIPAPSVRAAHGHPDLDGGSILLDDRASLRGNGGPGLVEWAGIENGIYLLAEYDAELGEIFALMEAQEAPVLDALCALAPPLVHFPDNLSSENLASLYDAWLGPTHQRRLARLHQAGIAAAVHLDGTIRGLLPQLTAAGFDAIEALTPQPVGDVALEEMRGLAGSDQVILWGGMPGAMFAPPFTWTDMEAHLHRLLTAWAGTPFIIGVADQVPPDGDITFCTRIAELLVGGLP
jgi:hypothetical protein